MSAITRILGKFAGNVLTEAVKAASAEQNRAKTKPIDPLANQPAKPIPDMLGPDSALMTIINPQARDRWLTPSVARYTPELIEQVLRGSVSGNLLQQWELFDLMEATWPHLSKALNELKRGVKNLEWNVQPWAVKGGKPTAEAQERAKFIEGLIWNMEPSPEADENDFEDTIGDIMDGWGKGLAVLEIDWMISDAAETRNAIVPRDTRWIHPRYYGYPAYGANLMLNTTQAALQLPVDGSPVLKLAPTVGQFAPFPPNKFLICVAKQKSGHPTGGALLRSLAFWWVVSNFTSQWMLNFAQIFGQPIRWVNYDATQKNLLDLISDMLENMGSSAWAAFPEGTKLNLQEASKSAADNPQAYLLRFADKICDIVVLGQTLTTDVGDSGSRALGDVHQDIRSEIIEAAGKWVARILKRQFIRSALRLNFGDADNCPDIMPSAKKATDPKALAERDQILLGTGQVQMPKEWFYNRHDIPMPAAGDDVIGGSKAVVPGQPIPPKGSAEQIPDDQTQTDSIRAKSASDKLTDNVLENLTGVEAKWLGGIKHDFRMLVQAAQSGSVTDEQFVAVLKRAQKQFPELFVKLDRKSLAKAMEESMGAHAANAAVQATMQRKGAA